MAELTKAIVDATNLPVTVKTRLGWDDDSIQIEEVAERLQDVELKHCPSMVEPGNKCTRVKRIGL
ncbi:MAG: tRNA-dihydrouridine synthase [Saprospiraceae bacterium]